MGNDSAGARIAVVTGASRGIGFEAALALAKAGCHIVAVARTQGGLEELDDAIRAAGGQATLVPLDLTDGAAIDQLGAALNDRFGRVDVLVGNAGVLGGLAPVGHIEPRKWDTAFAINITANYRLIRSLDPLLRQSAAARCVFVTSSLGWKSRPFWGLYAATKAALNALVQIYAEEVRSFGVGVNLINPGALRTRMRGEAMPGEDPNTLKTPAELAPHIVAMVAATESRSGELFDFPTLSWMKLRSPQ
jgi:NAD(P)-dependent dehydrogenase (short-subunit alcohol dehydrogenase family)